MRRGNGQNGKEKCLLLFACCCLLVCSTVPTKVPGRPQPTLSWKILETSKFLLQNPDEMKTA